MYIIAQITTAQKIIDILILQVILFNSSIEFTASVELDAVMVAPCNEVSDFFYGEFAHDVCLSAIRWVYYTAKYSICASFT